MKVTGTNALEMFVVKPLDQARALTFLYLLHLLDTQNLLILCKMLLRRTGLSAMKTERCHNM